MRKEDQYSELELGAVQAGYSARTITVEIGSRVVTYTVAEPMI